MAVKPARSDLGFFNGLGGFSADGREYVITTSSSQRTPAPWVNVLANPQFGTVVSESGLGYTWSENAHEFRLTPWSNDAVCEAGGEAFYLRDEDSAHFWSPTPLPCGGAAPYVTRHGFGYSVFEHTEEGIRSELRVFVDREAPVKYSVLKVANRSGRPRRLSATGYVEWVLGDLRPKTAMHVVTADRSGERRAAGEQRLQRRVRRPHRVLPCRRCKPPGERQSHRVPRPQRQPRQPGGDAARAALEQGGRGARSLRRAAGGLRSRRRRGARDCLHAGRRRKRAGEGAARRCARSSNTGSAPWARCRWKRRTAPSTCWRTAGCSTRRWRAACGLAAAITSRAAPSASAISCRTSWRCFTPSRASPASSCCAAQRISSAKAMCSIGGIRRRAAACARTARTTTSGCRGPRHAMWRAPAMRRCWTRRFISSTAARSTPRTIPITTCRRARAKARACTSTACAPSSAAPASASMGCR